MNRIESCENVNTCLYPNSGPGGTTTMALKNLSQIIKISYSSTATEPTNNLSTRQETRRSACAYTPEAQTALVFERVGHL